MRFHCCCLSVLSNSVWLHWQQPTRLPHPWDSQARTMEWVAISFLNEWKWKVKVKSLSRVLPLATPWTAAYQAPPSVGFSRQEYWSGVPLPSLKLSNRLTSFLWLLVCQRHHHSLRLSSLRTLRYLWQFPLIYHSLHSSYLRNLISVNSS